MAKGTRGQQDLNKLMELVGPSKPLSQLDLPSLRDILAAGLDIKEKSEKISKKINNHDLSVELTDLLLAVYQKANIQFLPGGNMSAKMSINNKIKRDWVRAVEIVGRKSVKKNNKEQLFINKLDLLYPVLICECPSIVSCKEKGCDPDCLKKAHIDCSCLMENRIPSLELLFIRDQRIRTGKGLGIANVDHKESKRLTQMFKRKKLEEEGQQKLKDQLEEENNLKKNVSGLDCGTDENDNDLVNDPVFAVTLKKMSNQNRVKLDNLARESIRGNVSVRTTASLATALLIDLKIVTKEDAHLIVDPSKIQRARERVMKKERELARTELESRKLDCIFFDGRKDESKMIIEDEDGDEFARTDREEHYTATDPHKYLTHITPEEGSGAKGVADKLVEFLVDTKQLENVKVIGGDSTSTNTGWKEGSIHHIEVAKDEKVLWDICMLHVNELPLRHLMKDQGMETSGVNSFTGELGDLIKDNVNEYEVNDNFEVLDFAKDLRDLSEDIIADLSSDQKYLYKIVKMIITGELDYNVLKQVIGPINHSRWLTTGSSLCRLWVSKHGLRKNSKSYKNLKAIVSFIVSVYAPIWFEIKCRPNILHGPDHLLTTVQLVDKYCSPQVKAVVEPVIQRGAWHGHPENLLLSMIGSDDLRKRTFAVNTIKMLRGGEVQGDSSVRDFHVPELNFQADSLYNLIDWSGDETVLHEPVLTCGVRTDQLEQYLDKPLSRPNIDCHTQSCERAVKVCFSFPFSYLKSNLFFARKQQLLHPRSMALKNAMGLSETS